MFLLQLFSKSGAPQLPGSSGVPLHPGWVEIAECNGFENQTTCMVSIAAAATAPAIYQACMKNARYDQGLIDDVNTAADSSGAWRLRYQLMQPMLSSVVRDADLIRVTIAFQRAILNYRDSDGAVQSSTFASGQPPSFTPGATIPGVRQFSHATTVGAVSPARFQLR